MRQSCGCSRHPLPSAGAFRLTKTRQVPHKRHKRHTRSRYSTKVVEDRGMPQSATCESPVIVNLNRVDGHLDSAELWLWSLADHTEQGRKVGGLIKQTLVLRWVAAIDRLIVVASLENSCFLCPPANYLHIYGLLDGTVIILVLIVRLHTAPVWSGLAPPQYSTSPPSVIISQAIHPYRPQ